ncbi:MAG: prohibitin family protein [Rhodospirillaceae bacterium]|nr:prohibitin family protein [Rhodospirillaceae bacterium]MBT4743457.1 prohibitin family protein [Rhodospirillaceae bacterium]MBT6976504.1 prohibitin family protein [Rhodospirillaceae bacterium]
MDDEDLELQELLRIQKRRQVNIVLSLMLVAVLGLVFVFWDRIVILIRSGESGVLYDVFSGTDMEEIYGEGLHIIWPWNRMHVYNVRLQTKERTFQLLTRGGLPIDMKIAIRYRPDIRLLPLLHVTLGPSYLDKVVFPETEAVLRRAVGQYSPEEVYTSKRGFLETLVISSLLNVEDRYVIIDDVLVRSVELPELVRKAIENKLALLEERKAYTYRLEIEHKEAERKKIEAGGIKDYQNIIKQSLTSDLIRWQGIQATKELATSPNAKTVVIGAGKDGLPIILGGDR